MDPVYLDALRDAVSSGNPLAIAAIVYLARVTYDLGRGLKQRSNGGTHEDQVERKLDAILDTNRETLSIVREARREEREAHRIANARAEATTTVIAALTSAVERNVNVLDNQTRMMERIFEQTMKTAAAAGRDGSS